MTCSSTAPLASAGWWCTNAANAAAGLERLRASGASVEDATRSTVMLAVQGPEAPAALREVLGTEFDALEPRRCAQFPWRGGTALVARTGYTGEDGAECIVDAADGAALWQSLLAAGVAPAGLGARDTLRLEAALPLHGNDIDASTNPYEARLGWTVTLSDGAPFTGREALPRLRAEPPSRRLCALRLLERGVPRHGYRVLDPAAGGDEAGVLTQRRVQPHFAHRHRHGISSRRADGAGHLAGRGESAAGRSPRKW